MSLAGEDKATSILPRNAIIHAHLMVLLGQVETHPCHFPPVPISLSHHLPAQIPMHLLSLWVASLSWDRRLRKRSGIEIANLPLPTQVHERCYGSPRRA